MVRYRGDPFWTTTRYHGRCFRCGRNVSPGEECFYYPLTKTLLCDGEGCGKKASAEFAEAARVEEAGPQTQ